FPTSPPSVGHQPSACPASGGRQPPDSSPRAQAGLPGGGGGAPPSPPGGGPPGGGGNLPGGPPPGGPNPPGPPGGPNPPGPRSRISLNCAFCSSFRILSSRASTSFWSASTCFF